MIWRFKKKTHNFPLNPLSEQSQYDSHDLIKWQLQRSNQATFTGASNCAMSAAHRQPVLGLCSLELDHMMGKQAPIDCCCVPGQAPQHTATSGDADPSLCRVTAGFHPSTLVLEPDMPDTNCQKKLNNTAAAGTGDTEDGEKPHLCTGTVSCQHRKGK